jgi:uncharacterized protein YwqG
MFRNSDELRQKIRSYELAVIEDKILQLAKPSVQILRSKVKGTSLPLGSSKLGGNPDLPKGFHWPYRGNKALGFIGQFRLSELGTAPFQTIDSSLPKQIPLWDLDTIATKPRNDFPLERGLLYFFYDIDSIVAEERDCWQIFYFENEEESLERKPHPRFQGKWRRIQALPEHQIQFYRRLSLPIFTDEMLWCNLDDENMPPRWYQERYWDMVSTSYPKSPEASHYFYGYPRPIQDSIESYCVMYTKHLQEQGIAGLSKEDDWQFLFQIDSDMSLGMTWGDNGSLYVCIPKNSLEKHRFEDCWVIFQSH